jgi:YesN/AraC family two-component response regulator
VTKSLTGYPIRTAENGQVALEIMAEVSPSLVVLDLIMPGMNGFEVLRWMRSNQQTRHVPVLVLSGQVLCLEDVKQLEQHALVTLHSKGILSEVEAAAALHRALFHINGLPPHTSALVKRASAYIHQNYDRPITRQEIAEAVGASKDYLSDIFHRELGLSPWDYLNRYRILHAEALLRQTDNSITHVAYQVGFNDLSYFGRIFHKIVGLTPRAYKKKFS